MQAPSENNVIITLPVNLSYAAIEGYLKENYTGYIIEEEKENGNVSSYAEILGIAMEGSAEEEYDIAVDVAFRNLTSVFHNKTGRILLQLSLFFNEPEQEISVDKFKLEGNSGSWLMDNAMEAMANTFLHKKIKNKMVFDFRPIIEKQLEEFNRKLEEPYEVNPGMNLYGNLKSFRIHRIVPKIKHFYVLLNIEADAVMDIEKLDFNPTPTQATTSITSTPPEIPDII